MADISTYIQWIQNAQYGEEVRSAIINAITKINEDNESYINIKNEVVTAKDFVDEKILILEIAEKILESLTAENVSADSNIKELRYENSKNQDLLTALEELHDIRIGVDETVYDSAGEAVRTQIKELANEKVTRPETAEVGQVLAVKATDESGKPTEFEATDQGGGVSDEKIATAVEEYMTTHPFTETDPTVPEWAKQPEKPSYTAEEVGADTAGTAVAKVSEHNTASNAHNDIRVLLQGLANRLNALADSDDTTLDQMSEVVAYIKSNKSLIDAITTSKINVSDIIDNLTTNVSNKPLSAAQGVALKALIEAIAVPTKLSELENDSGYAKATDIPDKLPNPQKLTFAGAVTAEYNGSGAVTVTIPESSGGSGGTVRIEKLSTDTAVELEPNKLYIFPEMSELTITLAEITDTSVASEYHFIFQSGAAATTLSIPDTVNIPSSFSVDASKIYEVSILEGCLCAQSWAVS